MTCSFSRTFKDWSFVLRRFSRKIPFCFFAITPPGYYLRMYLEEPCVPRIPARQIAKLMGFPTFLLWELCSPQSRGWPRGIFYWNFKRCFFLEVLFFGVLPSRVAFCLRFVPPFFLPLLWVFLFFLFFFLLPAAPFSPKKSTGEISEKPWIWHSTFLAILLWKLSILQSNFSP